VETKITTLPPKGLWLGMPLVVGLFVAMLSFLYSVLLGGPWTTFLWSGGLSLALIFGIKFVSIVKLDDKRQLLVSAMLWELLGGVFGWTWIVLALASFWLFVRALFFGGNWGSFFIALVASGASKRLYSYSDIASQAAAFKKPLIEKGLAKEQARKAWIAEAERRRRDR
jgi:hypothetical protein